MTVSRILILNLTRLGDLLQTSPTIASLRGLYPDAHLTLAAESNFAEVCEGIPGIDELVRVDLDTLGRQLLEGGESLLTAFRATETLLADLRGRRFDLALNLSSSRMTAVLLGLLQIPDVRGWTMTADGYRMIRHPWARLFASLCLNRGHAAFNLVDSFRGMAGGGPAPRRLLYTVTATARSDAGRLLDEAGIAAQESLVALHLGASREIRRWPRQNFAACARALAERGHRVLIVGGRGDREIAAEVVAAAGAGAGAIDLCGKTTIPVLAALLERVGVLVTGDTGPMHVAAAVGTPVVGLFFGPASPHDTGPYGEDHVVLHAEVACAPCAHAVRCLNPFCRDEISPATVAATADARVRRDFASIEALAARSPVVRFHRTAFDPKGFYEARPMGGRAPSAAEVLRRAHRALWLAELEGVAPPLRIPGGELVDTEAFDELANLAARAQAIAEALRAAASRRTPDLDRLEELGQRLAASDEAILARGAIHPEVAALTQTFQFGKENLEGEDVASIADGHARLYERLVLEARTLVRLLRNPDREVIHGDDCLRQ